VLLAGRGRDGCSGNAGLQVCADSLATLSTLVQIVLEDHQIDWYQQNTFGAQKLVS